MNRITELTIFYDQSEVILSVIIAIFSSYAALNMIDRVNNSNNPQKTNLWLIFSALAMGLGTWTMHFMGMIALRLDIPIYYDAKTTVLSLVVSILSFYLAFYLSLKVKKWTIYNYIITGIIIGFGISTMHYIGMKAMIVEAIMEHDRVLVVLSILLGIIASILSLFLFSKFKNDYNMIRVFILPSSIVMGIAISGMHYTAMAGFRLYDGKLTNHMVEKSGINFVIDPSSLSLPVLLFFFCMISISIFLSTKDRVKAVELVQQNQKRYQLIAEHSSDLIVEMNSERKLTYVSPSIEKLLGYKASDIIGTNAWYYAIHPSDSKLVYSEVNRILDNNKTNVKFEYQLKDKKGKWVWLETTGTVVKDKHNQIDRVVFSSKAITDRKTYEKRLERMAYFDLLTNVPNRAYFTQMLEKEVDVAKISNEKFAVLYFDCDQFKWINDSYGHGMGDKFLQIFVQNVKSVISSDDLIGRFGGDEFVILLRDVQSKENVVKIANYIVDALNKPIEVDGINMVITSSIGISMFPDDSFDVNELIKFSDRALYKVKKQGKNGYLFSNSELNNYVKREMRLASDLRHAIQKQELFLQYQPLIKLPDAEVVGVEGLVRWKHSDLGLISPGEFIPIAEDHGLIKDITAWVLLTACNDLVKRPTVDVSVNISSKLLYSKTTLLNMVKKTIEQTRINPNALTLEITETAVMKDISNSVAILENLKKLGVRIALDDFGTGLSSLTYIKELPLDILKIDQAFIQRLPGDTKGFLILKRIIQLAKDLDLKVVVEGVEMQEQVDMLLAENVSVVQGFLFSKPLNENQLDTFIKHSLHSVT